MDCPNLLAQGDLHTSCAFCLGPEHLRQAILTPGYCPCCLPLSFREKQRRLHRVEASITRAEMIRGFDLRSRLFTRPAGYNKACTKGYDDGHDGAPARKVAKPAETQALTSFVNPFSTRPAERQARVQTASGADYCDRAPPTVAQQQPPQGRYQPTAPRTRAGRTQIPFPDDEPPHFDWERQRVDWDVEVDQVDPLDHPPQDYRVVDEEVYDEEAYDEAYEEEAYEEEVYEGDAYEHDDDPLIDLEYEPLEVTVVDEDQAAPGGDPVAAVVVPPAPAPAAAAAPAEAAAAAAPPPAPIVMDTSPLLAIFKTATVRCGLQWPAEQLPTVDENERWQGLLEPTPEPTPRVLLPLANGMERSLKKTWDEPLKPVPMPRNREGLSFDTEDNDKMGLSGLPPIDKTLAAFLLDPNAPRVTPLTKAPALRLKIDRDASALNEKLFASLSSAGKYINAGSLLQGSMSALLLQVGTAPTAEQMGELLRLHNEAVLMNRAVCQQLGRAMASAIVQERERWLNVSPELQDEVRGKLQKLPIKPEGLFEGAMEVLALIADDQKKAESFRDIQQPPPLPRQPPPRHPPRQAQRQAQRQPQRQTQRPPGRPGDRSGYGPNRGASQDSGSTSSRSKSRPPRRDDRRRDDPPAAAGPRRGAGRGRGSKQRK